MNIALILYLSVNIILLSVILLGAFFFWGAIRRWPMLFKFEDSMWMNNLIFIQRFCGDKGLVIYYIVIGLTFITFAVIGLVFINKDGML
jgi:hypothetical protein